MYIYVLDYGFQKWVSEMNQELADLVCQEKQTGDVHCIDMSHSCWGGGERKEVHVHM